MIIAIDMDDTMTNTSELITEYVIKHFDITDNNLINEILGAHKIEGDLLEFYHKYLIEMISKYELKDNVKEVIDNLRKNNHKVIIVTARGYTIQNGTIEVTNEYLKKNNIIVDDIIFRALDKSQICLDNKVDILIDDSISVLNKVSSVGIKTLLFTSVVNKDKDSDIERVSNWMEIQKYIENINV